MANDPPAEMLIMPGDVVALNVLSAQEERIEGLAVDERGVVHIPLAGDVVIGGLSLGEAEDQVNAAMRRFDRGARAHLTISDPAGHRATVLGAVTTPGYLPVTAGMRVGDLLAAAGGPVQDVQAGELAEYANLDAARLVRGGKALPVSIPLAMQGDPRHNIRVRPGDALYVPPALGRRVVVLGKVVGPGAFAYRSGMRLTEALALAAGVNRDGDTGDIRVIRGPAKSPQVYTTSLWAIKNGRSYDVELAPGDVVYVTEHWIASVGEVLDRVSPLLASGATVAVTATILRR